MTESRRKRHLTLRRVEELTGIPNAYFSQLETGRKTHLPPAQLLFKLAECLGVMPEEFLVKARYLNQTPLEESMDKKVERAFRHAVTDPRFRYGANLYQDYDFDIKRIVVELYEKAMRRVLIKESESDSGEKPQTRSNLWWRPTTPLCKRLQAKTNPKVSYERVGKMAYDTGVA